MARSANIPNPRGESKDKRRRTVKRSIGIVLKEALGNAMALSDITMLIGASAAAVENEALFEHPPSDDFEFDMGNLDARLRNVVIDATKIENLRPDLDEEETEVNGDWDVGDQECD